MTLEEIEAASKPLMDLIQAQPTDAARLGALFKQAATFLTLALICLEPEDRPGVAFQFVAETLRIISRMEAGENATTH